MSTKKTEGFMTLEELKKFLERGQLVVQVTIAASILALIASGILALVASILSSAGAF